MCYLKKDNVVRKNTTFAFKNKPKSKHFCLDIDVLLYYCLDIDVLLIPLQHSFVIKTLDCFHL